MNAVRIFKSLAPVDYRNIRRDSLLLWIPILPIAVALLMRVGVPRLAEFLSAQFAFDLTSYYPFLMSTFMLLMPGTIGLIIGFLLLDERDDHILTALLVTPMPINGYLLYRLGLPVLLSMVITLIAYPLVGLVTISLVDLLAVSLLGAFSTPIIALLLATLAENKVSGFAVLKFINTVQLLPSVAYFVHSDWQLLAGIIPSYWPLKVFWLAAAGQPYAIYLVVGLGVNLLALGLLLRRFNRVVHR